MRGTSDKPLRTVLLLLAEALSRLPGQQLTLNYGEFDLLSVMTNSPFKFKHAYDPATGDETMNVRLVKNWRQKMNEPPPPGSTPRRMFEDL